MATEESNDGWVTGDAMMVALTLRPLQPGDLVKPVFDPIAPSSADVYFVGQPCVVTDVRPVGARARVADDEAFFVTLVDVAHPPLPLSGVWVNARSISAWKPKTAG